MTNTFEDLMRNTDPARGLKPLDEVHRKVILDAATSPWEPASPSEEIPRTAAGGRSEGSGDERQTPLGMRRRTRGLAAVAAAVALVAVGALWQLSGPSPAEASADEALRLAALNATDPAIEPGQVWRIETTGTSVQESCSEEGCIPAWRTTSTAIDYVDPAGDSPDVMLRDLNYLAEALTDPPIPLGEPGKSGDPEPWAFLGSEHAPGSWQSPNIQWLSDLPRDTSELRRRLYADSDGTDQSAFTYAVDVLRSGKVPAELRVALFKVMETIPGIEVTRSEIDVEGLRGVEIGFRTGDEVVNRVVLEPESGQIVGELTEYQGAPLWSSVTTRTLVDGIPPEHLELATKCVAEIEGTVLCEE